MSVSRRGTPLGAPGRAAAKTLQPLGVTAEAERVYRALLRGPDGTLRELAANAGISAARARRAVGDLESAGLVSRRATRPVRYLPAAPGTAVEALILRREKELEGCRLLTAELTADFRDSARGKLATQVIEVIADREVIFQRFIRLLAAADTEVLMFDKPPYVGPLENPFEMEALERGVSWRAIYAPDGLYPDRMEQIRRWQHSGEKARVHPEIPVKLAIMDRKTALMQMTAGHGSEDMAILIHPCALLDALTLLFDSFWRRAVPLSWNLPGLVGGGPRPAAENEDLLRLLAAGFKDEAIARQLGVSTRTIGRRLADVMRDNGVSTRFQLGILLARQGWSLP
jgi:sugar-specific transcriptional regulator TrmB/DNA-binding CsgD family transcriptional regulator